MTIALNCKQCGKDNNTTYKIDDGSSVPNIYFENGFCSLLCFNECKIALGEKEIETIKTINKEFYNVNITPETLIKEFDKIPILIGDANPKPLLGVKFDTNKIRWDLLPVEALQELAKVYTFGASKYSDRNWEKGLEYNRLYRAAFHHLTDFWMGKNKDDESGLHSLAHCAFNVLALLHFELLERKELDNRPKRKD